MRFIRLGVQVAALAGTFAVGASAATIPVTLTLTGGSQMSLQFALASTGLDPATATTSLAGTMEILLESEPGDVPTALQFAGSQIEMAPWSATHNFLHLGHVTVTGLGVQLDLQSTGMLPIALLAAGPDFEGEFDPGAGSATQMAMPAGLLTYTGTGPVFNAILDRDVDLEDEDVEFGLPSLGAVGRLVQSAPVLVATGGGFNTYRVDVSLATPFEADETFDFAGVPLQVSASGALEGDGSFGFIEATGSYLMVVAVPEPSSLLLALLGGAAGLGLLRSRRR